MTDPKSKLHRTGIAIKQSKSTSHCNIRMGIHHYNNYLHSK